MYDSAALHRFGIRGRAVDAPLCEGGGFLALFAWRICRPGGIELPGIMESLSVCRLSARPPRCVYHENILIKPICKSYKTRRGGGKGFYSGASVSRFYFFRYISFLSGDVGSSELDLL